MIYDNKWIISEEKIKKKSAAGGSSTKKKIGDFSIFRQWTNWKLSGLYLQLSLKKNLVDFLGLFNNLLSSCTKLRESQL